jgi:putative toxin-antitoxin system antitoxin component (TIGR02293 family)
MRHEVVRFTRPWQQAVTLWETEEAAREWLASPSIALGGAIPLEFAATEAGARMVEDTMGRIAHGLPL